MSTLERKDEVNELYEAASYVSTIARVVFAVSIVCSIIMLTDLEGILCCIVKTTAVISTITYVFLVNLHDMHFFYQAESERRKTLISNALGIEASSSEINLYYNNPEKQSVIRLGVNSYESAFFTKKIIAKMLMSRGIGGLAVGIIYITLLLSSSDLDVIILVTQTLFSGEILIGIIKLTFYYSKLNIVLEEFHGILIKSRVSSQKELDALLLDAVMDYECLKSYCQIALSSRVFYKYNTQWSKEWKKLYQKIRKAANKSQS